MATVFPKLSYSATPMSEGYIYQTLPERLRDLAEEDPNREAFVFYNSKRDRLAITRQELLDKSTKIAESLLSLGFQKGNHVGFLMQTSLEMLICNMAAVIAGGIPFFMSTNVKDFSDVIATMNQFQGVMLFYDLDDVELCEEMLKRFLIGENDTQPAIPTLKCTIVNGMVKVETASVISYETLSVSTPPENITLPNIQPEDTLLYFCTSGSTGNPKNVPLTHYSVFNWTKQANKAFGITNKSRFFNERTFSWIFGYPRTYLTEGATRISLHQSLSSSGGNVEFICDVIEKEQCDVIFLPGYIIFDLLPRQDLFTKFKNVVCQIWGGERLPKETISKIIGKFSQRICSFYGTTEIGGCSQFTSNDIKDFADGIIGKPLPGVEMKIVDQSGRTVPVDVQGEICVRNTWRFSGYLAVTPSSLDVVDIHGWFHTGDIGRMRSDGNFVSDGRAKEVISTGTNKYFPWIFENRLRKMPNISQAIAIGVPDERLGEVVCACVVPKTGYSINVESLKTFCDQIFLDGPSVLGITMKPKYHLVLETLPVTSTGKIDRRQIGTLAREHFNLN